MARLTRIASGLAVGLLVLLGPGAVSAQSPQRSPLAEPALGELEVDGATVAIHASLMRLAAEQNLAERPIGEVIQRFARALVGSPYRAHMLDQHDEERLVVSLAAFDCVLFVEAVLALARAVQTGAHDFESFARNIERLRYRDGRMRDYCSRLHYFTDWLHDNDRRGNIRLVTDELDGATAFRKRISFMTDNRGAYRGLRDDQQLACIAGVQDRLNRLRFSFIPQEDIAGTYGQLRAGDVVALTTGIAGLDIAHTGFVYIHPDGSVGFIHASTTGQVRIERDLASYVRGVRNQTGMMVARMEP